MVESARRVLAAVDRFAGAARADRAVLRVAHVANADTMSLCLAQAIADNPWLRVQEHAVPDHRQLQDLRDHRLDVALCSPLGQLPEDVDGCLLRLDPLVVTAQVGDASPELLAAAYGSAWTMHDAVVDEFARTNHCPVTRVPVPAGSGQETAALLRAARGRRTLIASSALGDADVVTTPLSPGQPQLRWTLIWRRDEASAEVRAFVHAARELGERRNWSLRR